jgi:phage pi2 protein 07
MNFLKKLFNKFRKQKNTREISNNNWDNYQEEKFDNWSTYSKDNTKNFLNL